MQRTAAISWSLSHIVTIGEVLWDLIGGREYLGGAPLNFSVQCARLGHRVSLVSAVGDDDRGRAALARIRDLGVSTSFVRTVAGQATGTVGVTVDAEGQPSYAIHRPAAYDFAGLDDADFAALTADPPEWIAFGTLHSMDPRARALLGTVIERFPRARRFYDVNLRRDSYTPGLVNELLALAHVAKLTDSEVAEVTGVAEGSIESFCRTYAARFGWQAVCITRGAEGCALFTGGEYVEAPGVPVTVADTVGAGDAFDAALVHGLECGWPAARIAEFANRLGALVASRPGGTPEWSPQELEAI